MTESDAGQPDQTEPTDAGQPDQTEPTDVGEETPEQEAPDADNPTFADLGLDKRILKALRELGYERPSPIQAETIPVLLAGHDVVGLAQTGTGKTAAFALPILEHLEPKSKHVQALVLAPTRELALQVAEAFETYAAHLRVRLLPVYGGQGYGVQLSALARGVDIVVGTPGRVIDHLDRGTLDLTHLRHLVLDEADEMLNMGFAEDVEKILADTPADKQVALFSATMPPAIRKLARTYLNDPVEVQVKGRTSTAANVTHRYTIVAYPQKVDALTRILEVEKFDGVIVFVRTKIETETVAEKLRARGFSAAAINGDLPQAARERTINQLKAAKLDILVATDVAARGLDVDRISHVVNFDIPTDTESYVHRIGRTGRAGRSGDAISFVTPRERHLLRAIERATGQELAHMPLPSADDINATRLSRFDDAITAALGEPDKIDFFRDVVAHYVREYDVPEVDVAAALAAVLQGDEPMLLDPEPAPRGERFREDRKGRRDDDRHAEGFSREPRERPSGNLVPWRIEVGRRQRITPRQIVGALANEGGLTSADMGRINIRADHTIIELPPTLPPEALEQLSRTRVSGKLINLAPDEGSDFHRERPRSRPTGGRPYRKDGRDKRDGFRKERREGFGDRPDRSDRSDRSDRFDRSDRPERRDRTERRDRFDRSERGDRQDRPQRFEGSRSEGGRPDKKFKKPRHK